MTLSELAAQYRGSAAAIKERINLLRRSLEIDGLCQMEKLRLRIRIDTLASLCREANETALYLERYYDRRYRKNGRFTV